MTDPQAQQHQNSSQVQDSSTAMINHHNQNDHVTQEATQRIYRYSVSGSAAHTRLVPLLPSDWQDCSPSFGHGKNPNGTNTTGATTAPMPLTTTAPPDFVWENAPRKDTKAYRDTLKAYSHLPNGTAILDSKWVLARLLKGNDNHEDHQKFPLLAALESHCFRAPDGYRAFCQQAFSSNEKQSHTDPQRIAAATTTTPTTVMSLPDLLVNNGSCPAAQDLPQEPSSLWVVKDAFSNGAGGIWVVDAASAHTLNTTTNNTTNSNNDKTTNNAVVDGPLYEDHRYVAQRYAWPPVLYGGRKCHVRVYGLIAADGRAFVHKRAFLHVANDVFSYKEAEATQQNQQQEEGTPTTALSKHQQSQMYFQDSVHITNCCANSHDDTKFSGEILADLEATEFSVDSETGQTIVPLGAFLPSMKSSLAALTEGAFPFISGGQGNNGFEYLGMDFILSYKDFTSQEDTTQSLQQPIMQPVAYMLEINAPPSQDTATGLKHAEDLHDDVIRDILKLWVLPKVTEGAYSEDTGGWRLAYTAPASENDESGAGGYILPSKATIINKIRWGMAERKATKQQAVLNDDSPLKTYDDASRYDNKAIPVNYLGDAVSAFARSKFPFFQRTDSVACGDAAEETKRGMQSDAEDDCRIFWENAGGSQVPHDVIEEVSASLRRRNRSVIGSKAKDGARSVLSKLCGAHPEDYSIFLASNASSLLVTLADRYVQLGLLQKEDEIVLSTENHLANVNPWLMAAKVVGARVKWWAPTRATKSNVDSNDDAISTELQYLLSPRTKILAVSHASNLLGQIRDISTLRAIADKFTGGKAHLVVDGVAAAPHWYPNLSDRKDADWYVVSCHKCFGPHLGALCGSRQTAVKEICHAAGISEHCDTSIQRLFEIGTVNYEGCAGIRGLGQYCAELAVVPLNHSSLQQSAFQSPQEGPRFSPRDAGKQRISRLELTSDAVVEAYRRIRMSEQSLVTQLLQFLGRSPKVRIIEIDESHLSCVARLPVVSFVHKTLNSSEIVKVCARHGVACRYGDFLSNEHCLRDFDVSHVEDGVVRFSLVHYNTSSEIEEVATILEAVPGWF